MHATFRDGKGETAGHLSYFNMVPWCILYAYQNNNLYYSVMLEQW